MKRNAWSGWRTTERSCAGNGSQCLAEARESNDLTGPMVRNGVTTRSRSGCRGMGRKISGRTVAARAVAGFTLVEMMIVVAVIALLAAIAVPNFLRARKRTQASRILEDLRLIDSAVDQYAIEFNKAAGDNVPWAAIQQYLKPNSSLFNTGVSVIGGDYTGAAYTVDGAISTPAGTAAALGDVAPVEFWTPFQLQ